MKSIVVTGSSGFLGSEVVKLALSKGYRVVGIDVKASEGVIDGNFHFIQSKISELELRHLPELDFIVHTASSLPYGNNKKDFSQNNIQASKDIANIARDLRTFLVQVGSSSVYGKPVSVPIDRDSKTSPLDAYGASKLQAEVEISNVLSENEYCVIRPRTILGKGRGGIFSIFFSLIKIRFPIPLPNSGRQTIQFVHVSDLATLCLFLGGQKLSGIWPAASPNPKKLMEHLKVISRIDKIPIRYIPINPTVFRLIGSLMVRLKITKFTMWHFGAFPYDSYFEETWAPRGFTYKYSSEDAFIETWRSSKVESHNKRTKVLNKVGKPA
jgi:nucleoside-diphosphate-sugar epimerase